MNVELRAGMGTEKGEGHWHMTFLTQPDLWAESFAGSIIETYGPE